MATQMEEFEASTKELVIKVEALVRKINAMVGTEDEEAAGHAADADSARIAAEAAATAAHDTLVAIQALDANQIVIDVGLVLQYKNDATASADLAAAHLLSVQQLKLEIENIRTEVAEARTFCNGVKALAQSAQAALEATTLAQAAINQGLQSIVTARDNAVSAANSAVEKATAAAASAKKAEDAVLENIRDMVDHSVLSFPINQTVIRVDLPQNRYSIAEPVIICVINGAPTNVSFVCSHEFVAGLGEVYTYVTFTFPPALVGKKCNAWISG